MNGTTTLAFTIYRSEQQHYFFKLKTGGGTLLLTGYGHLHRADCEKDIHAVKLNAGISSRYQFRMTKDTLHVFLLKNSEGRLMGKSEAFADTRQRDSAVETIKMFVREALVYDLT